MQSDVVVTWYSYSRYLKRDLCSLPFARHDRNKESTSLADTSIATVYSKKYAHGFCFAVLCCGYTLTDFPISIRLTSLALWQSLDCPSASKATLMNMDKYFMWIHYERLHNHNKAKHNKTVCIFLGIYCKCFHYTRASSTILQPCVMARRSTSENLQYLCVTEQWANSPDSSSDIQARERLLYTKD